MRGKRADSGRAAVFRAATLGWTGMGWGTAVSALEVPTVGRAGGLR